jgi:hypothetical protein
MVCVLLAVLSATASRGGKRKLSTLREELKLQILETEFSGRYFHQGLNKVSDNLRILCE